MKAEDNNQAPDQSGDVAEWLADSLVYIQKTTADLARDFENFRGRVDSALEHLSQHGPDKKIDKALAFLETATCNFNRAGHIADQKRRGVGLKPMLALGVVLLIAMGLQTVVLSGGMPKFMGINGLTDANQKSLENCIKAVRKNNKSYECRVVVRPGDL